MIENSHDTHPTNQLLTMHSTHGIAVGTYRFNIQTLEKPELKKLWQELELRATPNFFLSWYWIESWLEAMEPTCHIVQIFCGSELVGLGLLTSNMQTRHKIVRSQVLRLTRTGDLSDDQIWIEYNDLLLDQRHQASVPPEFIRFLLQDDDWDEFELGATDAGRLQLYAIPGVTPVVSWSAPTYGVDLAALRAIGSAYLTSVSSNTRHQISRTRKLYGARGQLNLEVLSAAEPILQVWPTLADMHLQRWGDESGESGFANEKFAEFHQALIQKGSAAGVIELCVLRLDDQILGCLYNFTHENIVYFYLSGLSYESDARLKPGMLLHAMAIQQYLDRGFVYYDFLGGEARYKKSLGQPKGNLQLVSFQRSRLKLKIERGARRLKHWAISAPPSNTEPHE